MNNFISILLYLAFFLTVEIVPTSEVYACGGNKNCCKMMLKNSSKSKCCCSKDLQNQKSCNKNQKEGRSCNGKNCPCPQINSTIQFGAISNQLDLTLSDLFLFYKIAWMYILEIPTPIYLSIWLKPKISCTYLG